MKMKHCIKCGKELTGRQRKFCVMCRIENQREYQKIYNKTHRHKKKNNEKSKYCDEDCFNCKNHDCIMPYSAM